MAFVNPIIVQQNTLNIWKHLRDPWKDKMRQQLLVVAIHAWTVEEKKRWKATAVPRRQWQNTVNGCWWDALSRRRATVKGRYCDESREPWRRPDTMIWRAGTWKTKPWNQALWSCWKPLTSRPWILMRRVLAAISPTACILPLDQCQKWASRRCDTRMKVELLTQT